MVWDLEFFEKRWSFIGKVTLYSKKVHFRRQNTFSSEKIHFHSKKNLLIKVTIMRVILKVTILLENVTFAVEFSLKK